MDERGGRSDQGNQAYKAPVQTPEVSGWSKFPTFAVEDISWWSQTYQILSLTALVNRIQESNPVDRVSP